MQFYIDRLDLDAVYAGLKETASLLHKGKRFKNLWHEMKLNRSF